MADFPQPAYPNTHKMCWGSSEMLLVAHEWISCMSAVLVPGKQFEFGGDVLRLRVCDASRIGLSSDERPGFYVNKDTSSMYSNARTSHGDAVTNNVDLTDLPVVGVRENSRPSARRDLKRRLANRPTHS